MKQPVKWAGCRLASLIWPPALIGFLCLLAPDASLLSSTALVLAEAEQLDDESESESLLSLSLSLPEYYVDTKIWISSNELGLQHNWLDHRKPCTLLERIKLMDNLAVSLGDSMDSLGGALESSIRDIELAANGLLLLEDNSDSSPADSLFIKYLNSSGDCYDSDTLSQSSLALPASEASNQIVFEFRPESDRMSWFNPDNWASSLIGDDVMRWLPDSYRIPCVEDAVIFGKRLDSASDRNGGDNAHSANNYQDQLEQQHANSFKVHFRPSSAASDELGNVKIDHIRVSKLTIGNQQYDTKDFERLIQSDVYKNILFQFNDSSSALKPVDGYTRVTDSVFFIDESSVKHNSQICLDEAGCLCGNEQADRMKIICSFHEPIDPIDLPCHDPVSSSGYCNKICASIITIIMDPNRFKVAFVSHAVGKFLDQFDNRTFVGAHRTHENKYEIIIRIVPTQTETYDDLIGKDRELAQLIVEFLNKDTYRSYFGIKSINLRASLNWRANNRSLIFIGSTSIFLLVLLSLVILDNKNHNQQRTDTSYNKMWNILSDLSIKWLDTSRSDSCVNVVSNQNSRSLNELDETESIDSSNRIASSLSEIQLSDFNDHSSSNSNSNINNK